MKPIRRIFGMTLFLCLVLILGVTAFPIIYVFKGIDKANDFMDKYLIPLADMWD